MGIQKGECVCARACVSACVCMCVCSCTQHNPSSTHPRAHTHRPCSFKLGSCTKVFFCALRCASSDSSDAMSMTLLAGNWQMTSVISVLTQSAPFRVEDAGRVLHVQCVHIQYQRVEYDRSCGSCSSCRSPAPYSSCRYTLLLNQFLVCKCDNILIPLTRLTLTSVHTRHPAISQLQFGFDSCSYELHHSQAIIMHFLTRVKERILAQATRIPRLRPLT